MRIKYSILLISLLIFILAMPASQAMQMAQAPIPSDWAYISGVVTYNGNPQDGVSVFIPGGDSDTTRDGGYYKIYAYPRLAVAVTATYRDASLTRTIEIGAESSNTTYNIDLVAKEKPATPTPNTTQTVYLVGSVMHDGSPLPGVFVQVSPITRVKTDMTGQFMVSVPRGENLTISVETPAGKISQNVTSPTNGTSFVVNMNSTSPTPTATAIPTTTAPTSLPPTTTPAPGGSESLVILAVIGLLAAIGLAGLRRE